jgi:hypothetical protein
MKDVFQRAGMEATYAIQRQENAEAMNSANEGGIRASLYLNFINLSCIKTRCKQEAGTLY